MFPVDEHSTAMVDTMSLAKYSLFQGLHTRASHISGRVPTTKPEINVTKNP